MFENVRKKSAHYARPLIKATDSFLREPLLVTKGPPHIRDGVDLKRWMILVVFALLPSVFMAVFNTGIQKFVYQSHDLLLMEEFIGASHSLSSYFSFVTKDRRYLEIFSLGLQAFLPVLIISYTAGGLCEVIFAIFRNKDIEEGFLVTGLLFALILPPTIPYWMVAVGVVIGEIFAKELFGGTGMNIFNPALCCRIFLFFMFPAQMTGSIWVGTNPTEIKESIVSMNKQKGASYFDGITQATPLAHYNIGFDVKRQHIDALAVKKNKLVKDSERGESIVKQFQAWSSMNDLDEDIEAVSPEEFKQFITDKKGGLGLPVDQFSNAKRFFALENSEGVLSNWNFFFGNKLGSFGETSILASIIGAVILLITGVGSFRIMCAVLLGAITTAYLFYFIALFTTEGGYSFMPAIFTLPPYRHLLMGSLVFGAVFMATDPISAASLKLSQWIYGFLIGFAVIFIRAINPAYPEGVMIAILFGNVFAPLIDHYVAKGYRRKKRMVHGTK